MINMKTKSLTGEALDWAVGYAMHIAENGHRPVRAADRSSAVLHMSDDANVPSGISSDWAKGGPFIHEQRIATFDEDGVWFATAYNDQCNHRRDLDGAIAKLMIFEEDAIAGSTPLEAAMRCYVNGVVGKTIDFPMSWEEKLTPTR